MYKTTLFFLLFCINISFTFAQQQQYNYKKIDSLLAENSMIGGMNATKILEKEFSKDSIHAIYWIKYARACETYYKYEEAKKSMDKAVLKDTTNANTYFKKAVLYGNLNDLKIAKKAFNKAISIQPKGIYYYYRAILNQKQRLLIDAKNDLLKAIEFNYKTDELYLNLANTLLGIGEYENALKQINVLIKYKPKLADAYVTRTLIYYFLLDFDTACLNKKKAENLGVNSNALQILSNDFCQNSRNKQLEIAAKSFIINNTIPSYKQAIVAFTELIGNNNILPYYYLDRGYSYFRINNLDKANNDFDKAISLEKENIDLVYENIISLYVDNNMLKMALKYTNKQIASNPKNHKAYNARGMIYLSLEKDALAEENFKKSYSLEANFAVAYSNMAILQWKLKQYKKAIKHAKKAIKLNNKDASSFLILGKSKHKLGVKDFCGDFLKAQKLGHLEATSLLKLYCNK